MSIESAKYVVQRGAEQFRCQGDQLSDKLQTGDLLAVQHENETEASKYVWNGPDGILDTDWLCCTDNNARTYKVRGDKFKGLFRPPWYGLQGIWHVKNASATVNLFNGPYKAWDVVPNGDGTYSWSDEKQINSFDPGEELVFVADTAYYLFRDNTTQTWDFGELTDTSEVEIFQAMFANCKKFNSDIGGWDTSKVYTMASMFSSAESFNQNLSSWVTSKVNTMNRMFYYAKAFDSDISGWDTSSVTTMTYMFNGAYAFNKPIGGWNTSKVNTMSHMFWQATAFNQNINGWNTSEVTNFSHMFQKATTFNQPIGNWNLGKAKNTSYMFMDAWVFDQDLSNWNTSSVTNMERMFNRAEIFNSDISGWNTSQVLVNKMDYMFQKAYAFNQDLSQWCVTNLTEAVDFDDQATAWTEPRPVWGTCPRGET